MENFQQYSESPTQKQNKTEKQKKPKNIPLVLGFSLKQRESLNS